MSAFRFVAEQPAFRLSAVGQASVSAEAVTVGVQPSRPVGVVRGPQGEPGADGVVAFVHQQLAPASIWSINHGLGYRPIVQVIDNDENEMMGAIRHSTPDTLSITFSVAVSGRARLI